MSSITYGNGSDGALNVLSGTYYLNLDQKYQFSSIYVAAGATLSTNSPSGSVLYLLCSGSAVIDGNILLNDRIARGNLSTSVTIDGVLYSTPGVGSGRGGSTVGTTLGGTQFAGFGGGGAGNQITYTAFGSTQTAFGGAGGNGAVSIGTAGAGAFAEQTTVGFDYENAAAGTGSAGGGGGAVAYYEVTSGSRVLRVVGQGGAGGASFGANGGDGSGFYEHISGSGAVTYDYLGSGGGGAGGIAGKAGVHLVLRALDLDISGTINLSGTNGGAAGDGGKTLNAPSSYTKVGGGGGGGGGAGSSGNLYLTYQDTLTTGTTVLTGGLGGLSGGYYNGATFVPNPNTGNNGTAGTTSTKKAYVIESGGAPTSSVTVTYELEVYDIVTSIIPTSSVNYLTIYQPLPQKDYEFRVFTKNYEEYLGTWQDVSDPSWSQNINQAPSEISVQLSRSPDNVAVTQEPLLDTSGNALLDTNGDTILAQTFTSNAVGEGTDVNENLFVDIYVFYGGYEALLDTNGEEITDTNGEIILAQYGAPNGKRVYSGYIADTDLIYGENAGVDVTIFPHAAEQNHYVFTTSGGDTTVEYNTEDPVLMARDAMDSAIDEGSIITYDNTSMPFSGEVASYDFKLQTEREAIDKSVELLPTGYYHYVDPGENKQYLLMKAETPHHVFYYEKHITELRLKRSITQLVNKVYFVGGEKLDTTYLFKYYDDATSISTLRPGLDRISDTRVTTDISAQALSQSKINDFKDPRYRTTVTITDAVYDIESIKPGQMVAFKNFGNVADSLVLQIVGLARYKHKVVLTLDMNVPNDAKRLEDIKRRIQSTEVANIPVAPS